jgi:hypothetical protein
MFWFFLIGINALGWPCLSVVTGSISRSSMFLIYSEPSFASSYELFTEAPVDYFRYEFTFHPTSSWDDASNWLIWLHYCMIFVTVQNWGKYPMLRQTQISQLPLWLAKSHVCPLKIPCW